METVILLAVSNDTYDHYYQIANETCRYKVPDLILVAKFDETSDPEHEQMVTKAREVVGEYLKNSSGPDFIWSHARENNYEENYQFIELGDASQCRHIGRLEEGVEVYFTAEAVTKGPWMWGIKF